MAALHVTGSGNDINSFFLRVRPLGNARMYIVDKNLVRSLLRSLQQLEECEGDLGSWNGLSEIETSLKADPPPSIDSSVPSRSVSLLAHLKKTSEHLTSLSATFNEAFANFRTLAMPSILHHGLLTLPPEILSRIAKLTHPSTRRPYPAFSLVCRRFREIELNTPELWTVVNGNMSPERISLQIERAGGMGMAFEMIDGGQHYWRCDCRWYCRCDRWALIASNAERWKSARVLLQGSALTEKMFGAPVMHDANTSIEPGQHILCPYKLRGVVLPNLKYLSLDIEEEEEEGILFIRSWSMPNLRHLVLKADLYNTRPEPSTITPLSVDTKLDTFKLRISWMEGGSMPALEWVSKVLMGGNLTNLSRLELALDKQTRSWQSYDIDAITDPISPFKPILHVRHLSLTLADLNLTAPPDPTPAESSGPASTSFLASLLPQLPLLTPNLLSMEIIAACSIVQHPAFWDFLDKLLLHFTQLKDLRIVLCRPTLELDKERLGIDIRDRVLGSETQDASEQKYSSLSTDELIRIVTTFRDTPSILDVGEYELNKVGYDEEAEDWMDYTGPYFGPRYEQILGRWEW